MFDKLILKLVKLDPETNVQFMNSDTLKNSFISLKKYHVLKKQFLDETYLADNLNILSSLLNNENKIIHLKLELARGVNFNDLFDSINNQAKKLVFFINTIKARFSNLEIYLVGHSQGGLINLKTATVIPDLIKEIISISTPYKSVMIAKDLWLMDTILKLFSKGILVENSLGATIRYSQSVATLGNSLFYTILKNKWYRLKNKPKLSVICGTSAVFLKTGIKGNSPYSITMLKKDYIPTYKKYPFDGLVLTSEQNAIENEFIYNFIDPKIPCLKEKSYLNKMCATSLTECNKTCPLPFLHGVNFTIDLSKDVLKGKDVYSLDLIKSMYEGVEQKPLTNPEYRNYYEIFNSNYSHANILYSDDVVSLISEIINGLK